MALLSAIGVYDPNLGSESSTFALDASRNSAGRSRSMATFSCKLTALHLAWQQELARQRQSLDQQNLEPEDNEEFDHVEDDELFEGEDEAEDVDAEDDDDADIHGAAAVWVPVRNPSAPVGSTSTDAPVRPAGAGGQICCDDDDDVFLDCQDPDDLDDAMVSPTAPAPPEIRPTLAMTTPLRPAALAAAPFPLVHPRFCAHLLTPAIACELLRLDAANYFGCTNENLMQLCWTHILRSPASTSPSSQCDSSDDAQVILSSSGADNAPVPGSELGWVSARPWSVLVGLSSLTASWFRNMFVFAHPSGTVAPNTQAEAPSAPDDHSMQSQP